LQFGQQKYTVLPLYWVEYSLLMGLPDTGQVVCWVSIDEDLLSFLNGHSQPVRAVAAMKTHINKVIEASLATLLFIWFPFKKGFNCVLPDFPINGGRQV
jgi:hypothetical protein